MTNRRLCIGLIIFLMSSSPITSGVLPTNTSSNPLSLRVGAAGAALEGASAFPSIIFNLNWIDARSYGNALNDTAITTAMAANPGGKTLYISPGSWSIANNLTIPANITLKPDRGAILSIVAGKTLTLNGALEAGPYQVFACTGTGKVVFGSGVTKTLPEWWYDGGGDWAAAINAAVASLSAGTVEINAATTISAPILGKSNVNLIGSGSIVPTTATVPFLVNLGTQNNIRVSGLTLNGNGSWTATPFQNPAGGGNSIGFTNNIDGIYCLYGSSNITIDHCNFTGLGRYGIESCTANSRIEHNYFHNLGTGAVYLYQCSGVDLVTNDINGVYGNITAAGDTNIANSKFADGVLFFGCNRCTQTGGVVQDIKRIGTVFEGDGITLNDVITVSGVSYFNMNSCRGTEGNAAVWSEVTRSKPSLTVTGCTMNNQGATAGTLYSVGINGYNIMATGNNIQYFDYGVIANDATFLGNNTIKRNGVGVSASGLSDAATKVSLVGNDISLNTKIGFWIYQCHGTYRITGGNIFNDNGSTGVYNCGIEIDDYYDDQKVIISGNAFESSANQGDTVGQLYGIRCGIGGRYTSKYIANNTFLYTGTFSSTYPANLDITPCAYGYGSNNYELMGVNNNISSKWPVDAITSWAGYQRFLGHLATAPSSGVYRQGDYFLNNNPTSGSYMGWVCVAGGTPGSWKGFGAIQ